MSQASLGSDRIRVEDDVDIAYTHRGAGRSVVFVPGWTMSGEVFERQVRELEQTFEVVTIDPRSHGRSSDAATGNSYPQQGRDLAVVLQALDLHDVNLVGWSYGGLACYAYVEQYGTARVRSLTVIDQSPKPLATGAADEWAEEDLDGFLTEFIAPVVGDPEAFALELAEWLIDRQPTAREREWLTGMHLRTPRHAAACLVVSAMFSDYRELAGSLSSEIAVANVIRTECLAQAERWLSQQEGETAVWTMSSHLGFWDNPSDFTQQFRAFLDTSA